MSKLRVPLLLQWQCTTWKEFVVTKFTALVVTLKNFPSWTFSSQPGHNFVCLDLLRHLPHSKADGWFRPFWLSCLSSFHLVWGSVIRFMSKVTVTPSETGWLPQTAIDKVPTHQPVMWKSASKETFVCKSPEQTVLAFSDIFSGEIPLSQSQLNRKWQKRLFQNGLCQVPTQKRSLMTWKMLFGWFLSNHIETGPAASTRARTFSFPKQHYFFKPFPLPTWRIA